MYKFSFFFVNIWDEMQSVKNEKNSAIEYLFSVWLNKLQDFHHALTVRR